MIPRNPIPSTLLAFLLAAACGGDASPGSEPGPPEANVPPSDLLEVEAGKADGSTFSPHHIVDDHAFEDAGYITAAQIQTFLEWTVYERRSFLADLPVEGGRVADLLVEVAKEHSISPLVLLVRMQVEKGLVFPEMSPGRRTLDHAMGCGCHDGQRCIAIFEGLANQIRCAAENLRSNLDSIEASGRTATGWGPGRTKRTLDGVAVTPKNRATAALYTYTPWVLPGRGGNWLFWNIYRRYSRILLAGFPNHRWIGADCIDGEGCAPGLACLPTAAGGLCTLPCDRFCPDSTEHGAAVSFCAALGTDEWGDPAGHCVSRCETALFPEGGGCRPGFDCAQSPRFGQPEVSRSACLPAP